MLAMGCSAHLAEAVGSRGVRISCRQASTGSEGLGCRESDNGVHVLDESALYFAPPRRVRIYPARPPSARHCRGRAEAGPYARLYG